MEAAAERGTEPQGGLASSARANPAWISDESTEECMVCSDPFSFFSRRSHCRYCGWIVCKRCLQEEPVEVDRWVSSETFSKKFVNVGSPLVQKKVCRSCAQHAPEEIASR